MKANQIRNIVNQNQSVTALET